MVGLDDDPDVGPVAELGLLEHPAKQLVGQRPVGVLLHIDVDIGPQLAGRAEDRPQPAGDAFDRRLGVDRLELGRQARQLEREVDARDRAVLIAVDQGDLGRATERAGPARGSRPGRSAGTQSASASLMTASPSKSAVKASRRRRRAMTVCMASSGVAPAMNFRAITPADARAASASHSARCEPGRRQPERQAEPPGNAIARLGQILGQVPPDRLGRLQGRQRVDEPEKLDAHQRDRPASRP